MRNLQENTSGSDKMPLGKFTPTALALLAMVAPGMNSGCASISERLRATSAQMGIDCNEEQGLDTQEMCQAEVNCVANAQVLGETADKEAEGLYIGRTNLKIQDNHLMHVMRYPHGTNAGRVCIAQAANAHDKVRKVLDTPITTYPPRNPQGAEKK
ncbi:MAG: hypothetical protein WCT53_03680 [Candidatus Gracilibacteria bacterium]|jgi:hypothetical protein